MKYIVTVNGKKYEVEVDRADAPVAAAAAEPVKKIPESPKPAETAAAQKAPAAGSEPVLCPMPGTILDVRVSNGQKVKGGDTLLILEAMKMENEILAARDGVIDAISVTKGQSVNTGDMLLTLI